MYRVFGSPFGLATHQLGMYLRHKRLEHQIYSSSFVAARLAGVWFRAKGTYGCLGPNGEWFLNWQDLHYHCQKHFPEPQLDLQKKDSALNVVSAVLNLYASWWLLIVGGTFRWIHGENSATGKAHASYFLLTNVSPIADPLSKMMRQNVSKMIKFYGVRPETEPYVLHHFAALCFALDAHFAKHHYVLGTPHPTTADITLAAAFEGQFLKDDPPRTDLLDGTHANLMAWAERMGLQEQDVEIAGPKAQPALRHVAVSEDGDGVPPTLDAVLDLVLEVMPWLEAQTDALKIWHSTCGDDFTGRVKRDDGSIGVVTAQKAERLLAQPWTMAVDDQLLEAHVSLPHVHMANLLAKECRPAMADGKMERCRPAVARCGELLSRLDLGGLVTAPITEGGADFYYAVWPEDKKNP